MRNRKSIIVAAIFLLATFMAIIVGCAEDQTPMESVLFVNDGDFSEERLVETITQYQQICVPFTGSEKNDTVSFGVDFDVKSCSITRLSHVDDSDMQTELQGYIDLIVDTSINGKEVNVDTSWWYDSGEWTQQSALWSYLIRVEDRNGEYHSYYFRVDYTA